MVGLKVVQKRQVDTIRIDEFLRPAPRQKGPGYPGYIKYERNRAGPKV